MPAPKNRFERWIYDYGYRQGWGYGFFGSTAALAAILYPIWDWMIGRLGPEGAVGLATVAQIVTVVLIVPRVAERVAKSMLEQARRDGVIDEPPEPIKQAAQAKRPPLHLAAGPAHRVVVDVERQQLMIINIAQHSENLASREVYRRFNAMRIRARVMHDLTETQYLMAVERAAQAAALASEGIEPAMGKFFGLDPNELMDRIIDDFRKHAWVWRY